MLAAPMLNRRLTVNLALALLSVLVFALLSHVTGRVSVDRGLGWDGRDYARMTTVSLDAGTPDTRLRPFIVLLARIPYYLTNDLILSFRLMNHVYAFFLALFLCGLFDVYNTNLLAKASLILNISLCIATAKMFAYYPVLVDLGAYAILAMAFYCIVTEKARWAALLCGVGVLSREFALVAPLFGIHRSLRTGQPWYTVLLTYAPALGAFLLLRLLVQVSKSPPGGRSMISVTHLVENAHLWGDPVFVAFFAYFVMTIFGGFSMLLIANASRCAYYLREQPEWIIPIALLGVVAGLGEADIWRYLAYLLPVATMLFARCAHDLALHRRGLVLALVVGATVLTQRPLQSMDVPHYFSDWFPVYVHLGRGPVAVDAFFWQTWAWRFAQAVLGVWILRGVGLVPQRGAGGG